MMARLNADLTEENKCFGESDSDFAENVPNQPLPRATATTLERRSSPRKQAAKTYRDDKKPFCDEPEGESKLQPKTISNSSKRGKQIRLAPLNALSVSKSLSYEPPSLPTGTSCRMPSVIGVNTPKMTRKLPNLNPSNNPTRPEKEDPSDGSEAIEIEESVWCESDDSSDDSDEELPSPRKFLRQPLKLPNQEIRSEDVPTKSETEKSQPLKGLTIDGSSCRAVNFGAIPSSYSRPSSSSDKENSGAFLHFSPPRLHSPTKIRSKDRLVTPPQSPTKSRLQSPSKTRTRIPTPPLRQSLDAFWNADTVNDWNDQYSPQKILKSPRKLTFLRDDASTSPISAPRLSQSPSKGTRAEREAKKHFAARKQGVAQHFLDDLDRVVTGGKIQELAAGSGGVSFVWSKTLNSTAGRANWRRETTKKRQSDGTILATHVHYASIELAEKVIDDEHRLLNVIAHEFCHLANFMISEVKTQPHGKQFKEWGRRVTKAFGHRGVEVTTKHSYQIEYKYIWQCSNENCASEFKRHSKSIDPKRHTCGSCRGKLVQIKPAPRKDASSGTGYAAYVKTNFAEVKRSLPGASQKDVMEAVGRKYRAEKACSVPPSIDMAAGKVDGGGMSDGVNEAELEKVARVLEAITLDDD